MGESNCVRFNARDALKDSGGHRLSLKWENAVHFFLTALNCELSSHPGTGLVSLLQKVCGKRDWPRMLDTERLTGCLRGEFKNHAACKS